MDDEGAGTKNAPWARLTAGEPGRAVDAHAVALLLSARHVPFRWTLDAGNGSAGEWILEVVTAELERAQSELELYARENEGWPPPPVHGALRSADSARAASLAYLAAIVASFAAQQRYAEWTAWGISSSRDVVGAHEWWRVASALFLHGDAAHLASNALSGVLILYLLARHYGAGLSLTMMLLGGSLGNLLNAFFYASRRVSSSGAAPAHLFPEHLSLGASTAVFAALGLAAAMAALGGAGGKSAPRKSRARRGAIFVPVAAALAFLAASGSGPDTDYMAHFFGLVAGLALGVAWAWATRKKLKGV